MKPLLRALSLALLIPAAPLAAWESQLLPWNGSQYQEASVNFNGRDWRLLDFGHAGFELSAQPLGQGIPCNLFTVTGSGDITAELQTRVNAAIAAGGGRVIIPAGTFTVSGSIAVNGSNVSIEGAGSAQTFINVPSSYNPGDKRYEGLFTFGKALGGWNQAWIDRGDVLADVTSDIAEGSLTVTVSTTVNMAVGDWVVVRQYHWPAFSTAHSNGNWASFSGWPVPTTNGNRNFSFTYLRRITAINANTLTLDAPIPWRLRLADNPIRVQSAIDNDCSGGCAPSSIAPRFNLGLSGLSISFADNNNDTGFTPARATGNAAYFEGVVGGWVHDLQIRNFPRYGVYLLSSARISILDSAAYGTQDDGGDGYGYSWHIQHSQNVLVRRSYSEKVRHAYIAQGALTSMLVYSRADSAQARLGDDTHHSMVHANLWDRYRSLHGSGMRGENRGTTSSGAWETLGSGVVWNSWGDGHRGGYDGGNLHYNPLSAGYGLIVGAYGDWQVRDGQHPTGDLMPPLAGLQVGPTLQAPAVGSKDRNVLYEGLGQAGLQPESLFEAQLARRVGSLPADFETCATLPTKAPFAPATYSGPDTLILDVDHLDWTASFGSGCGNYHGGTWSAACHAFSSLRNRTPGGSRSARITPTGVNWAIMASWRGPTMTKADYTALELWVYPEGAGAEFRIQLMQSGYPENTDTNTAAFIVNGLTASMWNQVSIPMGLLGTGTFNKFEIRSTANGGGVTVFIDDVVLKGSVAPTPTSTATRTASPTASRTATRTTTRTASPTTSRTASPTASRTSTSTATRTASPAASFTSTPSPTPSTLWQLEAEGGVLNGTTAQNSYGGFSGMGYVEGFDTIGDYCEVTFNAPSTGVYSLSLRYQASDDKINDLLVNGSFQAPISFPTSVGWAQTEPVLIYLQAGSNQLRIQHNWGWFRLDRFDLQTATAPPLQAHSSLVGLSPSAQTQALMCWLALQYGDKVISGQTRMADAEWVNTATARYPALVGFDMMDYSPSRVAYGATSTDVEQAIAWHAAGGIVQFQWHWNAPNQLLDTPGQEWWRGFYTSATTYNIATALADTGGQDYQDLIRDLDAIAFQLTRLRDAGVPVLWRPLHEAQGGWFWWGAQGSGPLKQLYQLMFDRFNQLHGLNNLIWVWTTETGSEALDWYPGDATVDLVGADIYAPNLDYGPLTTSFYALQQLFGASKMIALTENGSIPDPGLMQAQGAHWLYFMTWNGYQNNPAVNSLAHVQAVYNHAYTLTRDELPSPVGCPLPATATPSPSPSPSPTATPSTSSTVTPSVTPTASSTRTATTSPTPSRTPDKPYHAGELRTNASYLYGRFETRMRAAEADGVVSSFFTFNDDAFSVPNWNEIDIEILGRYSDRVSFNVITYGQAMHEQNASPVVPDPTLCFHDYAIEWEPGIVRWFIDGALVASDSGPHIAELTFPQKLMMNLWPPNTPSWSLILNPADLKQHAFYDYVAVYNYTPGSGSAGTGNNYSLLWHDDFNAFDAGRWSRATHTFDQNDARFTPSHVQILDGHMVLSLTLADDLPYTAATVPADCGVTPTPSPSATATWTPSATPTFSFSVTPSSTPTLSVTATASPTPAGSPTVTGTPDLVSSPSPTATLSRTGTFTPTWTATLTRTGTPTATRTASPGSSPTGSASRTVTPTLSPTQTATAMPSPTTSATPGIDWYSFTMLRPCGSADACPPGADTVAEEHFVVDPLGPGLQILAIDWQADGSSILQRSWGPPASLGVTASASTLIYLSAPDGCHSYEATVTVWGQVHQTAPFVYCKPTSTPTPAPGPLAILDAVPLPHPNARELRVKLGAPAERLRARYYSPAMVLIAESEQGPVPQGWSSLALPTGLPNGLVYVVLMAWQGEQQSLPRPPLRLYFIP